MKTKNFDHKKNNKLSSQSFSTSGSAIKIELKDLKREVHSYVTTFKKILAEVLSYPK